MSGARKYRRRQQRQRGKHPRKRTLGPGGRIGLIALGAILIATGFLLVIHGGGAHAHRLARVAGFMLIGGIVSIAAGIVARI
ncbi:MAG: hypothetical protein NVSMB52_03020 [Chloroflexota bacterium]